MRRFSTGGARVLFVLGACAALAACGHPGSYAEDGDTGAAAPATKRDMSATPGAPDSTTGITRGTASPGIAGDSTGRRSESQSPAGRPTRTP